MQITPAQAPELIMDILVAGLVPMLTSSPGLGKSDIIRQIAKDQNLKVIDVRLAQSDPTDMNGFPFPNKDIGKAEYMPMDTFPIESDPIPKNYSGWLLFLDEMNSGNKATQAAAYKLILDRMVGKHHLHKNVAIVAAGNLVTDKAIVNTLSTAMQSRLIHLQLGVDTKAWFSWAIKNQIDHRIISYLKFKPEALHMFDPNHNDHTFACGRTWEFLSRIIKPWATLEQRKLPLLAGTISEGAGREFFTYCKIYKSLPTISDITNNPTTTPIDSEPSISLALSGLCAHHITKTNADNIMKFVSRLGIEFQILCLQQVMAKDRSMLENEAIIEWTNKNSQALL